VAVSLGVCRGGLTPAWTAGAAARVLLRKAGKMMTWMVVLGCSAELAPPFVRYKFQMI
jgi:hypothetical protein